MSAGKVDCRCASCQGVNPMAACTGGETLVPAVLRGFRSWEIDVEGILSGEGLGIRALRAGGGSWSAAEHASCMVDTGTFWGSFMAPIIDGPHRSPDARCSCGIYGWYDPYDTCLMPTGVMGAIDVSGRVLMGTKGFRAERARIRALAGGGYLADIWRAAGIEVFATYDELIAAFPPDDVSSLIPPLPQRVVGDVELHVRLDIGQYQVAVEKAAQQLAQSFARVGYAGRRGRVPLIQLDRWVAATDDPKARALERRRSRNTGPERRPRAPRDIPPRGSR